MQADEVRRTDAGVLCQSCAFQRELAKTRQRSAGLAGGMAGGAVPAAAAPGDSVVLGFVIGFICGCFGVAWAYLASRGPETKRGVAYGFLVGTALGIFIELMRRTGRIPPYSRYPTPVP